MERTLLRVAVYFCLAVCVVAGSYRVRAEDVAWPFGLGLLICLAGLAASAPGAGRPT